MQKRPLTPADFDEYARACERYERRLKVWERTLPRLRKSPMPSGPEFVMSLEPDGWYVIDPPHAANMWNVNGPQTWAEYWNRFMGGD